MLGIVHPSHTKHNHPYFFLSASNPPVLPIPFPRLLKGSTLFTFLMMLTSAIRHVWLISSRFLWGEIWEMAIIKWEAHAAVNCGSPLSQKSNIATNIFSVCHFYCESRSFESSPPPAGKTVFMENRYHRSHFILWVKVLFLRSFIKFERPEEYNFTPTDVGWYFLRAQGPRHVFGELPYSRAFPPSVEFTY